MKKSLTIIIVVGISFVLKILTLGGCGYTPQDFWCRALSYPFNILFFAAPFLASYLLISNILENSKNRLITKMSTQFALAFLILFCIFELIYVYYTYIA